MGAQIEGAGTSTIEIEGVDALSGTDHAVIADRIEMGSFMIAPAITGGDVTVTGGRLSLVDTLAEAMQEEYETIVGEGLDLQLDCPDLALSRHMLFSDLSDADFVKIADSHVEALNHALRNIDPARVRVHICWGNYEGPHICDIPMATMFDTLMGAKARYVLFETSNPRHGHEWAVFRDRKADIPDGKVLVPGVVDTTTNFVEHPDLVAERITRFTDIVGEDRVIAGSDCGFGTFAGFGAVDPDIAYAKLAALSEGAARAGA